MSTEIHQQITQIHQQARDLVEREYQGYHVLSIRNCSSTFYAGRPTSIVEMHVEAVKCGKCLYCFVEVNDDNISISSVKEIKACQWD